MELKLINNKGSKPEYKSDVNMEKKILIPSTLILIGISIFFLTANISDIDLLNKIFNHITYNYGSIYLIFIFAIIIVGIYISMSSVGNIKLGNDKPKHSFICWLSMLFCACIGSSILYWGFVEWGYYMKNPPFGIQSMSVGAAEISVGYTMFHWGISGWACYAVAAIIIAYFFYVKKIPIFRISVSCNFTSTDKESLIGRIVDIFVIIGLCSGVAVGIALGTPMISQGLNVLFGIPQSVKTNIIISIVWAIIFSFSAVSGIDKGVKKLSNLNSILVIILVGFILVCGPTSFILNNLTNSFGVMIQNFFKMSFSTEPVINSGFPQIWTVFYWAWWISYVPVMGLFIAKISYGRTIRQVFLGTSILGSLGCWIIQSVLGGYGLHLQLSGKLDVIRLMAEKGDYYSIMEMLSTLPFAKIIILIFTILTFVFLVTTCDSSTYILAAITSKRLNITEEPSKKSRIIWSILVMIWPIVLIFVEGIEVIKLCSVLGSIPLLFVFSGMIINFFKDIKKHKNLRSINNGEL